MVNHELDGGSFNSAFLKARREGKESFMWNGKEHKTRLKSESSSPKRQRSSSKEKVNDPNDGDIKSYEGSFNYALLNARKDGRSKFKWNGKVFGSLLKSERGSVREDNQDLVEGSEPQIEESASTTDDKNTHSYYDKSNKEFVVSAPRVKITRKTSGFIPQKSSIVSSKGDSRIYSETGKSIYYLTDEDDKIIGISSDLNALDPGYDGWKEYDPYSPNQIHDSMEHQSIDKNRVGEVRTLIQNQKDRLRKGEGNIMVDAIHDGREKAVNTVTQAIGTPDHLVWGAYKLAKDDDYKLGDYARGFNINPSGHTPKRIHGYASANDFYGPIGAVADMFTSVYAAPRGIAKLRNAFGKGASRINKWIELPYKVMNIGTYGAKKPLVRGYYPLIKDLEEE